MRVMVLRSPLRAITVSIGLLTLAACGGGGGSDTPPPPTNSAPVANAGGDQTVVELSNVTLDGGASSDANSDTLTYAWVQTAGINVTLSSPNTVRPSFTSPDVTTAEVLTFQLTVDDGAANSTDTVDITVQEALSLVVVAGTVSFEFVLPNNNCRGLNLNNPELRPIRRVTVQLLDASNNVLGQTVSGDDGSYSFANIDANIDVRVRVRAELKRSGSPSWDVEVRDNVDITPPIPPLADRPLYAVQWPIFSTGAIDISDADYTAETGWGSTSYTGQRAAAPFAILDAILDGMNMIIAVDPTVTFPPLDAFWSVNNTLTSPEDIDAGELPTSFYQPDIDSLFLLGDASIDTEEFDDHVVMHEWGHYFDDIFSRSDSIGGTHLFGGSLDPRLAFGEGFATALAAIALQNPLYCDTSAPLLSAGFPINTETFNSGLQGWFNEGSIATLIYDLWDTDNDGSDTDSIGFAPIYNTMVGPQASTEAFTTVFSFAAEIRPMLTPAQQAFVDSQMNREGIDTPNTDIWGDSQQSIPSGAVNGGRDLLPIFTEIPTDGSVANLCINNDYSVTDQVNKLGDWRYLRFTTSSNSRWTITVTANPVPPPTSDTTPGVRDRSDPDVFLFRRGQYLAQGTSGFDDQEVFVTPVLGSDTYVIAMQEWRYEDPEAANDFPTQVCYDVTMNP